MALRNCPECGQPVSEQAATCPHCGHRFRTVTSWIGFFIALALLCLILYGAAMQMQAWAR